MCIEPACGAALVKQRCAPIQRSATAAGSMIFYICSANAEVPRSRLLSGTCGFVVGALNLKLGRTGQRDFLHIRRKPACSEAAYSWALTEQGLGLPRRSPTAAGSVIFYTCSADSRVHRSCLRSSTCEAEAWTHTAKRSRSGQHDFLTHARPMRMCLEAVCLVARVPLWLGPTAAAASRIFT